MVITISNTDDFIRALRENGDFQAAARRELLTQDLLELPREFRGFQERTDERLEEIGGEIKEARSDIDGLGEAFRREVRAQSSYRGNYAQTNVKRQDNTHCRRPGKVAGNGPGQDQVDPQDHAGDMAGRKLRDHGCAGSSGKGMGDVSRS